MTLRDVRPPDLEMQVHTAVEHGKTRLSFTLHSPTDAVAFAHRKIAGPVLHTSAEEYQAYLLRKIEKLSERLDVDDSPLLLEEIDRKMASLGHDLWRELFPLEIRSAYREIRRSVHSWMIVSDEPCIPWELAKPYDSSRPDDIIDDDFLALKFELTRWLAGENTPAQHISVRRLAVFRTAPDLPQSQQELELLKKIAQSPPGVHGTAPQLSSAEDLLPLLETIDAELLHFIGHGTPGDTHPDEAGLPFQDGSSLRPLDLDGPIATRIGRNRPLVFLNACWAGRQGWSLTRLGGWTARWVDVCGAGAFIAPMWPARDQMTLAFAQVFYGALAGGAPLGKAAWEARSHLHRQRPGDPSVLAYTVYGHPNARVCFGSDAPGAEAPAAENLPAKPPEWVEWKLPRNRRRRRWLRTLTAACGAALIVYWATLPLPNLLFPVDPVPARLNLPAPPPQPTTSTRGYQASLSTPSETCPTAKGFRVELSGGKSSLRYTLKSALCRSAVPLSEEGISGWTISLALDTQEITPVAQGQLTMQSCRLTGSASARGPAGRFDLGPVDSVNAQFNGSKACEAATGSLAEGVLSRFVAALPKEGEP